MSFDRPALPYNGRCAFARCEICSRFDDDTIETFCSAMATKRYAAGASIPVVTGPDARALIIREGIVCVTHAFQDGRRQILELLFPGDLLLCEPQDDDDTCRIDAACDVVVCETPRDHLFERALRYPEIGRSLLSVMQDMVSRKNRQLIDLGRKRAEERVASFLLEYSRRMSGGRAAPRKMRLRIQRGTIADLLCLTRETISRSLTILREEGIIHLRYHDEVEIVDLDALWKRASGDDQAVPK